MSWEWNKSGEGSCKPCSPGTYKNGEVSACQLCPEGSTSKSGSGRCSCSAGYFWNGVECLECSAGTASHVDATECTACPTESISNNSACMCEDGAVWKWEAGAGH